MKKVILIPAIIIFMVPVAVWAMYKPVRVLAPEWVKGVSCPDSEICIDDESRYSEASELYEDALQFVASTVGPFQESPQVIFCANRACFQSFGFNKASASTVGKSGIVVSPRGWKGHYLRHEMIHHRQAEELGVFASLVYPEWFIEGMAYSVSDDTRMTLSDPWQQHRAKFEAWYQKVGKDRLWNEARNL